MGDRRRRENDPALYRRRLRKELQDARRASGLDPKAVQQEMDWSSAKFSRIEAGTVTISKNDLLALLRLYDVHDKAKIDDLVEVARLARERSPWWFTFRDVASAELLALCGYESSSNLIRNFEPLLVPGLLQTEDYARDLFKYLRGPKEARRTEGLVRLRIQRQNLLEDEDREVHFLLDESVIRRIVGSPAIMRDQLEHLQAMASRPHISIGIIPFSHGMYRSARVPYVVFEFEDAQDETILYLEDPRGELIIADEVTPSPDVDLGIATPEVYLEVFFELQQVAVPLTDSPAMAEAVARLNPEVDLREAPVRSSSSDDA